MTIPPGTVRALNDEASALVRQGLEALDSGADDGPEQALACFDRALELRHRLPVDADPWLQFDLAGTWLNRAGALVRLGGADRLADAVRAQDAAIALLGAVPLTVDPSFPRRLAIAHQNRGMARLAASADMPGAADDYRRALDVLQAHAATGSSDWPALIGAVAVSLAQVQPDTDDGWQAAFDSAALALDAVRPVEPDDLSAAEAGLLARHLICRVMAGRLHRTDADADGVSDDVHAATDAVDEGLELAAHWDERGVPVFRALAADLFRFGARVYARYQPHFVDEFVSDHALGARSSNRLAATAEMRAALAEVTGGMRRSSP
jgi:tetratricopeptide (TPR) repeat protein